MVTLTGKPAIGASQDGRLEVFVRGTDGTLYHVWQLAFGNDNGWSSWFSHGTPQPPPGTVLADSPVVEPLINADTLILEAVGTDEILHYIQQVAPSSGWTGWQTLGGASGIALIGPLEASGLTLGTPFALATDSSLYHWFFGSWIPFGGAFSAAPTVAFSADGRRELFAVGTDGTLYHKWETVRYTGNNEQWTSDWFSHGTPSGTQLAGKPGIMVNTNSQLELFVVGTDGVLYHIRQVAPSGGWTDWLSLGAPSGTILTGSPAVQASQDGRLELFVVGTDGALYHTWQVAPSGEWANWFSHGTPLGTTLTGLPAIGIHVTPTVGIEFPPPPTDLRLIVFVVGTDGALYHIWQIVPSGGWTDWISQGNP